MNNDDEKDQDMSVAKVAIKLGVSPKSVLEYIKRGELKAYKPGLRAFRITHEALEDFRKRRRVF